MPLMRGKQYRLALFDTNVLSEATKRREVRERLFEYLNSNQTLPAVSIWSMLELRQRPRLWKRFLSQFRDVPLVLFKTPHDVFEEERKNYPNPSPEAVVQYVFYPGNPDQRGRLDVFMGELFSDPTAQESENRWAEVWKDEVIEAISNLKSNFPPRGERYDKVDGRRFVDLGVEQWVIFHALEWAQEHIEGEGHFEVRAFPSVCMSFWTVFYRFYDEQRTPEVQDVFDILITSLAPYVEAVLTEGFQAEIFRKVHRNGQLLAKLEDVMTIKDVLAHGNST